MNISQKDRLFAEVTLSDSEFELYNQVYQRLVPEPPVPDTTEQPDEPSSAAESTGGNTHG